MQGTILCWVDDSAHGRAAIRAAADISDRLKLRLVLAHVGDGVDEAGPNANPAGTHQPEGTAGLVARLATEHGLSDRAERRSAMGEPALMLAQIAAEEAADLILVGAPVGGRLRRSSESRLAEHLESATTVPVLFVPARSGRRRLPTRSAGANVG